MNNPLSPAAVIGGGPAGLMAAEVLSQAGLPVDLYESNPSVGRKFLVAGSSGLNLTHSDPYEQFLARYGERRLQLEPYLATFGPPQLLEWAAGLGVQTFTGTSGRVFPVEMKAATLLSAWRKRLEESGVRFHTGHKWLGWNDDGSLRFETETGELALPHSAVILALGGASWPQLGSTGQWADLLAARGISLAPFKPANCGFDVRWSDHFRDRFDGSPLKSVIIEFTANGQPAIRRQGEFIVTRDGLEGSLIYALSSFIRDEIERAGSATIQLDLAPGHTREELLARLARPRGSRSLSSHLEKSTGLRDVKAGLLWEFLPRLIMEDPVKLAAAIKALRIPLVAPHPLAEAISTAGGVRFEGLDQHLMLKDLPGVFCAGEMLDWEAPTGGYLLTACFSTGRAAGQGALDWLSANQLIPSSQGN